MLRHVWAEPESSSNSPPLQLPDGGRTKGSDTTTKVALPLLRLALTWLGLGFGLGFGLGLGLGLGLAAVGSHRV